ncbi:MULTISPECIES: tyrosine-type recombinase/integrase [unclassified Mycobacterium]|uniref:tyrosine-type recombinase/integrase n=1 Tax=Mycobacterium sp. NS-7484 TaxID=1834161 RepID=UPI001E5C2A3D|nr:MULTISPECIES: tyrosine-type recombinase/integrase [unclassified Mycobacterium]
MLPPALGFHALRHTYASLCVAAGIPTVKVSRFMGHAKPSTTGIHLYAPVRRRLRGRDGRTWRDDTPRSQSQQRTTLCRFAEAAS